LAPFQNLITITLRISTCHIYLASVVILCLNFTAHSQHHSLFANGKVNHEIEFSPENEGPRAAACTPATALHDLEWNNVNALIETGGSLWQDRANGRSHYYVPKANSVSVLFAGALWLGGVSPDNQLKLAAIQYRYGGNDYWPGPLSTDGTAEATPSTCQQWDDFAVTLRSDAALHRLYFDCQGDPNCDMATNFPNGYTIPAYFNNYPAHGNIAQGQDYYIAPFYDRDNDGTYNPAVGDYPYYDLNKEIDCKGRTSKDIVPLYGDQTYYWVFNDKGNIHSESGGQAIGMEIRAQAFAFSTNDEINNMTFYNYVLINQGSQTLQETYFGTWIDCDIGGHVDDYVGCDVQRGLGYGYNGDAFDGPSGLSNGYGEHPPAVGVDFFEGPYQDDDGVDNPLATTIEQAIEEKGIPYKGIGIGYGDGIIDNERFGMRKFLYHISGSGSNGPPEQPAHYYSYLRGYWKNGQRMSYGGNAITASTGADLSTPADFMFPGDTDPLHFGTNGAVVDPWTEVSSGNPPSDRRFMQSAGPFTLKPGDYNNITVGVVYARSLSGDPFESVQLLRQADDKAQALFDNCFDLISGPDAPDVTICELENELILLWSNENGQSSNFHENFSLLDPTIPELDPNNVPYSDDQRSYKFQGYMIYQLADASVTSGELNNLEKARMIGQCDIADDVAEIINYSRDEETQVVAGHLMVNGNNDGIFHSLRVTRDAFALGGDALINHKTYYFMVIAYSYNNYLEYDFTTSRGQDDAFLPSRLGAVTEIKVASGIPHAVAPQDNGTITQATYGKEIALLQTEGSGNGHRFTRMDLESEMRIAKDFFIEEIQYTEGYSPVKVKVVDPLRVPIGDFELKLAPENQDLTSDTSFWQLTNTSTNSVYHSQHSIREINEELMLQWGLAIEWTQALYETDDKKHYADFVGGLMTYDDLNNPWLLGFPDDDSYTAFNWIRAGSSFRDPVNGDPTEVAYNDYTDGMSLTNSPIPAYFTDADANYEKVIGGTWSPYCLVSGTNFNEDLNAWTDRVAPTVDNLKGDVTHFMLPQNTSNIKGLNNVDIVFTPDTSLWTRCMVLEMQAESALAEGSAEKMQPRKHASLDKNGMASGTAGCNETQATLGGSQPTGMSWFPGYAIDINTGERLNMAFGEDSWLVGENGRDMIWNPTSRFMTTSGGIVAGGQHWIYVFKNLRRLPNGDDFMPAYDQAQFIYQSLQSNGTFNFSDQKKILSACTWVGSSILNSESQLKPMSEGLVPTKVRVELRVGKPFEKFDLTASNLDEYNGASNWWNPRYTFSTQGLNAITSNHETLVSALDMINVVPNPYYAFSNYESGKLDNRVKITNLHQFCTISIYSLNGTLIRQYKKADPITSLDWDLKNHKNIPIASGVYIIHVAVPDVGEKILKWFGVMRPVDLDSF
jgi:hypothetical protein